MLLVVLGDVSSKWTPSMLSILRYDSKPAVQKKLFEVWKNP